MQRGLVGNAADTKQIERANKVERTRRSRDDERWRLLLQREDFREVMWELLGWCNVHASIFEQSSKIYYNAGQQDLGHRLIQRICQADELAYLRMQADAGNRSRQEQIDRDKDNRNTKPADAGDAE